MATKKPTSKMTMAKWEKSPMDKKMDKNVKEGSKKDMKMDAAGVKEANKKVSKSKK